MHIPASDLHVRQPPQDEIESAPTITFAQFHAAATREGWDEAFLVKHCAGEVDTIRRVLHGAHIPAHDGEKSRHAPMSAVVLPYAPLLDLYFTHLRRPVLPPSAPRSAPCMPMATTFTGWRATSPLGPTRSPSSPPTSCPPSTAAASAGAARKLSLVHSTPIQGVGCA